MKWVSLLLVFLVVAGVIGISGCTSSAKDPIINKTSYPNNGINLSEGQIWNDTEQQYETVWDVSIEKEGSTFSKAEGESILTELTNPKYKDSYNIQNGTKTLNGYTVYYKSFTKFKGKFEERFFFEKNGTWYMVIIHDDQSGNPNKSAIDKEVTSYMNSV